MRKLQRSSLRVRLAALVCLGLLPTMGLILFTAFANRRTASEKGKAAALEKATGHWSPRVDAMPIQAKPMRDRVGKRRPTHLALAAPPRWLSTGRSWRH